MFITFILLGFIILYKSKFIKKGINEEYISIETTKRINGIFVLLVFFSHISQQVNFNELWIDKSFLLVIHKIGQLMVTTFLFYSGYGIYESIKKKERYVDSMPRKRILSTLIRFDIAVIIYAVLGYIMGTRYSIKTLILSLIGWSAVGNSNWYIFSIICMYIITYFSFKLSQNDNKKGLIINTIFVVIFMIIMSLFKDAFWYNTALCYPAGMWFSQYKQIIEKKLKSNKNFYITTLLLLLILSVSSFINTYTIIYSTVFVLAFIAIIVLLMMKFKFNRNDKILSFFGNNVFYIYIYQRIPMIIFKNTIIHNNRYLYFSICFIFTVIITLAINLINNRLYGKQRRLYKDGNK